MESAWPQVEAALGWIDHFGDRDGDGLVEYQRQSGDGLIHQGWKDSDDAIFHADGTLARGPIALCEVQGYVYAARRAGSALAAVLGLTPRAAELERQASRGATTPTVRGQRSGATNSSTYALGAAGRATAAPAGRDPPMPGSACSRASLAQTAPNELPGRC